MTIHTKPVHLPTIDFSRFYGSADERAAFIKELMRRSVQFHLERNGSGQVQQDDVEKALDEMFFGGGSLNLKLLGADEALVCSVN